jgi:zinc transport system substrate-binding protein
MNAVSNIVADSVKKVLIVFFIFCFLGFFASKSWAEKIKVIVTILPQARFVEKVGGERVQVAVMIPPGASPHTYEPTSNQLKMLSKSSVYFKLGSGIGFELSWLPKIISLNKNMAVVDCSKGVSLIKSGKRVNPHIWLSPKNAEIMVENIFEFLARMDPQYKEYYKKNRDTYLKALKTLDAEVVRSFKHLKQREFIVYHPAWTYFARDYGLVQIPIQKEGKQPTPSWVAEVIKEAKIHKIKIIFASPQFSTKSAETIANQIGGKVVLIDPLAKDYLKNMQETAEALLGSNDE